MQRAVYLLYNISKEYNLENATKKTKIIINDETLEQVNQFTYLGCNISYQFSNDVEFKMAKIYNSLALLRELFLGK